MPAYYNPYMSVYPTNYAGNMYGQMQNYQQPLYQMQQPQYMITVDGENAAKSWQPTTVPQPNTIIPIFDSDGQHVYFKTYDAYGRMNPIRKGKIVFEDEIHVSEEAHDSKVPDMSSFVTKEDLNSMRDEILEKIYAIPNKTVQNGSTKSR